MDCKLLKTLNIIIFPILIWIMVFYYITTVAKHEENLRMLCERIAEVEFQDLKVRKMASNTSVCLERLNYK